jgi:hypothetical protein
MLPTNALHTCRASSRAHRGAKGWSAFLSRAQIPELTHDPTLFPLSARIGSTVL